MPRLILPLLPPDKTPGSILELKGAEARYLSTVLRMRPGLDVVLCGPGGRRVKAVLRDVSRGAVELELGEELPAAQEPANGVVLMQGLLKGAKMDLVVQKVTELGVKEIVPVVCERSQVRSTRKAERWRKIAHEASRQCGRAGVPEVAEPSGLMEYLGTSGPLRGFVFSEAVREGLGLEPVAGGSDIYLLIGPEGGLTSAEVGAASEKGLVPAGLGPNILRAETAAIAALSLLQHLMGRMG
jgi:16S rRNA (uracil1498-N3)-methyltransferase